MVFLSDVGSINSLILNAMTRLLPIAAVILFCIQPSTAHATDVDLMARFKAFVNEMVTEVKATDDPEEKRAILVSSLERMNQAADIVARMPRMSDDDLAAIAVFKSDINDKLDELNGKNGYERVADSDLDEYADYLQQDLEQAQRIVISLSLTALILILIIILIA